MALFSRSDVMSVNISPASGGCGTPGGHSRPVIKGAPVKVWRLECPPCEAYLRGEHRPKVLKYDLDPKTRTVIGQSRVADADPQWSSTPDTLPLTPDEERTNSIRSERGAQQIQMIQALAALRATGIEVPAEAMWLLERELPAGVLKGTVLCAEGHDNQAGTKFCAECGISMAAKAAIAPPDAEPEIPLDRLHIATLRKKCRDAGLPDKGAKDVLLGRLRAA